MRDVVGAGKPRCACRQQGRPQDRPRGRLDPGQGRSRARSDRDDRRRPRPVGAADLPDDRRGLRRCAAQPPRDPARCAWHRRLASAEVRDAGDRRSAAGPDGQVAGSRARVRRALPRRTGEDQRPAPLRHHRPHPRPRPAAHEARRGAAEPGRRVLWHPRRAAVRQALSGAHAPAGAGFGRAQFAGAGPEFRTQPRGGAEAAVRALRRRCGVQASSRRSVTEPGDGARRA